MKTKLKRILAIISTAAMTLASVLGVMPTVANAAPSTPLVIDVTTNYIVMDVVRIGTGASTKVRATVAAPLAAIGGDYGTFEADGNLKDGMFYPSASYPGATITDAVKEDILSVMRSKVPYTSMLITATTDTDVYFGETVKVKVSVINFSYEGVVDDNVQFFNLSFNPFNGAQYVTHTVSGDLSVENIDNDGAKLKLTPTEGNLYKGEIEIEFTSTESASTTDYDKVESIKVSDNERPKVEPVDASWSGVKAVGIVRWDDNMNSNATRPENFGAKLIKTVNGTSTEMLPKTVTGGEFDDEWKVEWTGLPKKEGTDEISYSVKFEGLPAAYSETSLGSTHKGAVFTTKTKETAIPAALAVSGTVVWDDDSNAAHKRPKFTGSETGYTCEVYRTYTVGGAEKTELVGQTYYNGATSTFNFNGSTPQTINFAAPAGQPSAQYLHEKEVVEVGGVRQRVYPKYSMVIKKDGVVYTPENYALDAKVTQNPTQLTFTTTYSCNIPTTKKVAGKVLWDDNNNEYQQRPNSINVGILGRVDGNIVSTTPVSVSGFGNEWAFSSVLPAFDEDGKDVEYSLAVNNITGYVTPAIDKFTVTMKQLVETQNVVATKEWADENNKYGARPEKVKFQLYADGTAVGDPVEFGGEGNTWTYTWKDMPRSKGKTAIKYTVTEVNCPKNYTAKGSALTITNSYTGPKASASPAASATPSPSVSPSPTPSASPAKGAGTGTGGSGTPKTSTASFATATGGAKQAAILGVTEGLDRAVASHNRTAITSDPARLAWYAMEGFLALVVFAGAGFWIYRTRKEQK